MRQGPSPAAAASAGALIVPVPIRNNCFVKRCLAAKDHARVRSTLEIRRLRRAASSYGTGRVVGKGDSQNQMPLSMNHWQCAGLFDLASIITDSALS